jgi:hypothetical protein
MSAAQIQPRLIRPVQDPLGLFIRVARGDSQCVQNFLEIRGAHFHGVVIDPTRTTLDKDVRDVAAKRKLDIVLDPKTQESAFNGSFTVKLGKLPWGAGRRHFIEDFEGAAGKRRASAIAEFVKENGFTKVLTPSHLVKEHDDDWLEIDLEMANRVREALDRGGASDVPIGYSLAVPYSVLRDPEEFALIAERIEKTIADEIWLKVENFGSDASPTGARNYIEAMRLLHGLDMPLIADHVGGLVGLSLVAFGGVGGLSHGITLRERFTAAHWAERSEEAPQFGLHHRVYLPDLDLHVKVADARSFFEQTPALRARIGCRDSECCARGVHDMLEQPGHHFLNQRVKQFSRLGEIPKRLRASVFLDEFVRTASDQAMTVSNMRFADEAFSQRTKKQRLRLDALRKTLRTFSERKPADTFSALPQTRIVRESNRGVSLEDRRPVL